METETTYPHKESTVEKTEQKIVVGTVTVIDFNMKFESMITFILKWTFAALVASIVLLPIFGVLYVIIDLIIYNL